MPIVAVAEGISRIDSALGSRRLSQWLVVGRDGALLVDTGVAHTVTEHVAPALEALGLPPDALAEAVVTHADVDHHGGNAELRALAPGARLRAHAADRPLIESWARIAAERYGWYRGHGLDYDAATWAWLEQAAGPDVALDGTVAEGERIDLGGVAVEVVPAAGHSLGHVALWEPRSRTAIVGDAVMGAGFPALDGGRVVAPPPYVDLAAYRETIDWLAALAPERLGTAHFPLLEGEEVGRFLALTRRFTDDVERAIDGAAAAALPELLAPVARAVGGFPEMEVELARSVGAHLDLRSTAS